MVKITQKEAVFNAVSSVLSENNISIPEGTDIGPLMTKEYRSQVNTILFEGFRSETIELDREFNDSDLKGYVSGLQSNWIRKDKRLNGGIAYVAKNPGSRAGSGDPMLKSLRALHSQLTTQDEKDEVQGYIDARISEVHALKKPTVKIDASSLPPELAKYIK